MRRGSSVHWGSSRLRGRVAQGWREKGRQPVWGA